MNLLHILTSVTYLKFCSSQYEYVCPTALGWRIRGKTLCKSSTKYSCLHDENRYTYREICREAPSLLVPGNKYVIRGNLDGEECNGYRYQPFIFKTNQSSDCAFIKSKCSEIGQINYSNGSTINDQHCRCDYSKNFAPIKKTNNSCYCLPSVEDCSCHLKLCPRNTHLSSEYTCVSDYALMKPDSCGPITMSKSGNPNINEVKEHNTERVGFKIDRVNVLWLVARLTTSAGVLVACFLVIIYGITLYSEVQSLSDSKRNLVDSTINSEGYENKKYKPVSNPTKRLVKGSGGKKNTRVLNPVKTTVNKAGNVKGSGDETKDQLINDHADNQPILLNKTDQGKSYSGDLEDGKVSTENQGCDNISASPSSTEAVSSGAQFVLDEDTVKRLKRINPYLGTEIRIVMIGKTGVGKSATANTIIGQKAFKSCIHPKAVTQKCSHESVTINGKRILVVDTPGLFDTETRSTCLEKEIRRCITMTSPGPHAVLLVMKVTERYKKEDYEAYKLFLTHFGPQMKNYGIVIFTHGDELQKANTTLEEYIKDAPLQFKSVLEFFDNRKLLFNNDNEKQRFTQVNTLIDIIEATKEANPNSPYYTDENFDRTETILCKMEEECEEKIKRKDQQLHENQQKMDEKNQQLIKENYELRKRFRIDCPDEALDAIEFKEETTNGATNLPDPNDETSGEMELGKETRCYEEVPETEKTEV